jgi:hypothetical protein
MNMGIDRQCISINIILVSNCSVPEEHLFSGLLNVAEREIKSPGLTLVASSASAPSTSSILRPLRIDVRTHVQISKVIEVSLVNSIFLFIQLHVFYYFTEFPNSKYLPIRSHSDI